LHLSPGQAADVKEAPRLIAGVPAQVVIADRGYDSQGLAAAIEAAGAEAVIPTQKNRKVQRVIDRERYKDRSIAECFWARLKQYRRVATRYDKTDSCYLGFVHLASIMVMLR
jgi:transposase